MHASLRKDPEVQHAFLFPLFHQHRDLSEVHEPEADKADDLHVCPGDITVEKTAARVMPWLRR